MGREASFDLPGPKHKWYDSKEDSPENRTAYMEYLRNPPKNYASWRHAAHRGQLGEGFIERAVLGIWQRQDFWEY